MKNFFSVAVGLICFVSPVASQAPFYCGGDSCIIPMSLTCEEMIEEYRFQGSCCSLESIPETRGCRLTVSDRGNCFWYPYCGTPEEKQEDVGAGVEYTTDSNDACPKSEFDALFQNTSSPDYIPPENRTDVSCIPTMAPSFPPDAQIDSALGSGAVSQQYLRLMALTGFAVAAANLML